MQNNADSNADHPLTSNDAAPGDALSINATPDTASSSITAARDGNEEDAVTGMPKNDVDDSNTCRPHNDSTRVERDYEDDNPTPLLQTTEERTHTKRDSLSSPHPRSTTDHILGGETLSAASDQPQPADSTGTASDNDGVAVGEASHADRDGETTNDKGDNATSNTNTRGESPKKRARAENPTMSTQPEQSCHGSRTLRPDRARKPRALSQASTRTLSKECKWAANQAVSQTKKLTGEYHCHRRKDAAPQKDRKLAGPQGMLTWKTARIWIYPTQSASSVLSSFPFIGGKMTLRYLTYNVSGPLSKLDNAAFVNYITSFDFVCLTETYIFLILIPTCSGILGFLLPKQQTKKRSSHGRL